MDNEYIYALQSWYLPKYADLFKVIAYLGGCISQQQLSRLMFKGKADCSQKDALVHKLVEAKLLKIQRIGNNNILVLTYPVLRYLNLCCRSVSTNGTRIKMSSLILEKYLRRKVYDLDNPVQALKTRMEKTAAISLISSGEAHMRQLYPLIQAFKSRGLSTDGLCYQYLRAEKRMEHDFRKEYSDHKLALSKEEDLYTLACKNIYLVGVRERKNRYGRTQIDGLIDIYLISDLSPSKLATYIIEATRVVESTLQNDCTTTINVYSHGAENTSYMEKVYSALGQYPEYSLPNTAQEQVSFHFFDTQKTLFGGISPSAIR